MMRPPAPRAKPNASDAAGGAVPDVEPAAPSADARDRASAPPLGKTYDAPAWGGAPAREFYLDCVKGGALASRTRLDRGDGEDAPTRTRDVREASGVRRRRRTPVDVAFALRDSVQGERDGGVRVRLRERARDVCE